MPLPPEGSDLGLDMIESQCAATCDPGTAKLHCHFRGAATLPIERGMFDHTSLMPVPSLYCIDLQGHQSLCLPFR